VNILPSHTVSFHPIYTHCSISSVPLYCKHDALLKRPHSQRNDIHPAVESRQEIQQSPFEHSPDTTIHHSVQYPTHLTTTIPDLDTPGDYEQRQQPIQHRLLTQHGFKHQTCRQRRCRGPFSRIRGVGEDWTGLLRYHPQGQEKGNRRDPGAQGNLIRRHVTEGKGTIARRDQGT
jgi:hypothetical protein